MKDHLGYFLRIQFPIFRRESSQIDIFLFSHLCIYMCMVCTEKINKRNSKILHNLIIKPSFTKVLSKSLTFLKCIQENICPSSEPFHYSVLIDASTRRCHVCLLSTCNVVFSMLVSYIIQLKA